MCSGSTGQGPLVALLLAGEASGPGPDLVVGSWYREGDYFRPRGQLRSGVLCGRCEGVWGMEGEGPERRAGLTATLNVRGIGGPEEPAW